MSNPTDMLRKRFKAAALSGDDRVRTGPGGRRVGEVTLISEMGSLRKTAFVPSPQTQQQVQQAAASGQVPPPQQDANANAVSPAGVTLDDVVGMLEQMGQEISGGLVTLQNAISEMRSALPGPEGSKGGDSKPAEAGGGDQIKGALERIAQLEQMLSGMNAQQAQGQAAAQTQQPTA